MKTKSIINAVALVALLCTTLTLSARCAVAQDRQTKVDDSTEEKYYLAYRQVVAFRQKKKAATSKG